jgi:hypothetical protein
MKLWENFYNLKKSNDLLVKCDKDLVPFRLKIDKFYYLGNFVSSDLFSLNVSLYYLYNKVEFVRLKKKDLEKNLEDYLQSISVINVEINKLNKNIAKINLQLKKQSMKKFKLKKVKLIDLISFEKYKKK